MDYYQIKAISQSQLTNLSYGPKYYRYNLDKVQEDSDAMLLGSVVDCLITEPDKFNDIFYISKISKPSGQMGEFCDWFYHYEYEETHHDELPEGKAYHQVGFKRDTLAKVLERFEVEGRDYYNELVAGRSYKVISPEMYDMAQKVVDSLLNSEYTKPEFEGEEVHKQFEILWDYVDKDGDVYACKSRLDLMIIDHTNKIIYPKDIKVKMDSIGDFYSSFVKFRYDLQAAFYTDAVEYFIFQNNLFDSNGKRYDVAPFRFIVESAKYPGTPLIFQISDNDLKVGRDGGTIKGRKYKGYKELIEDLKFYERNNRFDYERSVIENRGVVITNVFDREE